MQFRFSTRLFLTISVAAVLAGCPGQQKGLEDAGGKGTGQEIPAGRPDSTSEATKAGATQGGQPVDAVQVVDSAVLKYPGTGELAYHGGQPFTGRATTFYKNGQQATEVHFLNGMRHGVEARWFEDGAKKFEGRFRENELVGVFEVWYQNGQRKSQEVWQDGKRQSLVEWDEKGNLLRRN